MNDRPAAHPLRVVKITPDSFWLLKRVNACTWEHFEAAPPHLEVDGKRFSKRSFVFDGILYLCGEDPVFDGTEYDYCGRRSLQDHVTEWTRSVFTTANPVSVARRVVEEAYELLEAAEFTCGPDGSAWREAAEAGEAFEIAPLRAKGMADECADILHCLFDLCALIGEDLDVATRNKLEVNKRRKWSQPDVNNQRRHLREDPEHTS